jgi:hypothetical protein
MRLPWEIAGTWPLHLVLLVAQWSVLVLFARHAQAARRALPVGATVRESLERLWQEAESSRRGQLAMLALFAVAAPLLLAMIAGLRASGKMAPHEAMSAGALFAGVLVAGCTAVLVRRYGSVLPRHRHLSTLLEQYRSE